MGLYRMLQQKNLESCCLCRRPTPEFYLEKHHLTPRCKKGKTTILFCCDCGNQVHNLFSIKELEMEYHTIEALLANERIRKWIRWIRKRHDFGVCMKTLKRK